MFHRIEWFPWAFSWLWLFNKKLSTKCMVGLNPTYMSASLCGSLILSFQLDVQLFEGKDHLAPLLFLTNSCFAHKVYMGWMPPPQKRKFYMNNTSATEIAFLFWIVCRRLRGRGSNWKSWAWIKFVFGPQLTNLCLHLNSGGLPLSQGGLSSLDSDDMLANFWELTVFQISY